VKNVIGSVHAYVLLRAQFECHAIINCHVVTLLVTSFYRGGGVVGEVRVGPRCSGAKHKFQHIAEQTSLALHVLRGYV